MLQFNWKTQFHQSVQLPFMPNRWSCDGNPSLSPLHPLLSSFKPREVYNGWNEFANQENNTIP